MKMPEMIEKRAAYKALKHEADTHMLPESKEAYERSARIIDQMKPDELPPFEERTCDNCGSGEMLKYMHENKPSAPDNAAGEFLLYLLEQIPLDTLIAYVIKRKERDNAGVRLIDANAFSEQNGNYYAEEGPEEGFIGTVGELIDEWIKQEAKKDEWN